MSGDGGGGDARIRELEASLAIARAELKLYRSIVERAWTITWIVDAAGRVKYMSPSRIAMGAPDMVPESIFDQVPPDQIEAARAAHAEVLASPPNRPVFLELSMVRDGKYIARDFVLLNRLDDPDLQGILISGHDIGPDNARRFALQSSYERLALSAAKEHVWEWDPKVGNIVPPPPVRRFAGVSELHVVEFLRHVHASDRELVRTAMQEISEQRKPFEVEWRLIDGRGGRWYRTVGSPIVDERGSLRVVGRTSDVHDRKTAELELRARAEREELLRSISRRLLDEDFDAAAIEAVRSLGRTVGAEWVALYAQLSGDSLLRRAFFWTKDGPDATGAAPPRSIVPGAFEVNVAVARLGNADRSFGALAMAPASSWTEADVGALEAIAELLGVAQTRREAAAALAQANDDARAASRAKSAFLVAMSHELRSPLHAVIGMVDLIGGTQLDERQKRYVEIARASARGLLSVINDVLDVSKIEAGKLDLDPTELSVQEVIDEACCIFGLQAEEKRVGLVSTVAPLPRLVGDGARLRQILVNLVGNAIKFTSHGEVEVRAFAIVPARSSGDVLRLRIEVRDTGIGVPSTEVDRIFAPFAQVDGARYGGTGLGLTISRELVSRMGGTLGVESTPGAGATFWLEVELPRAKSQVTAAIAKVPSNERARVLVLAARPVVRKILEGALSNRGFAVDAISTVESIGEELASRRPGIAIVVDEAGTDGRGAAARLANDARLKDTRVIFIESLTRPLRDDEVTELKIAARCSAPVWNSRLERIFDGLVSDTGEVAPVSPRPAVHGACVLVIDDSEINAEVTSEVLRAAGYHVDVACDGEDAIAKVSRRTYDLALVDCLMPGIDGYETARAIRRLEREGRLRASAPLPLVALTASATSGDRERALEAGMNEHLTKPFDANRLLRVVATHLRRTTRAALPRPSRRIDLTRALARLGGDSGVLGRALGRFVEIAPETLALLGAGIAQRDEKGIRLATHRLRGQASMFDANQLVGAIEALEHDVKRHDWPAVDAAFKEVEHELDEAVREFAKAAAPSS